MTYQCEVHGTPRYSACRSCVNANARNTTRKHRREMRRNFEEQSKARQAAFIEKKEVVVMKAPAVGKSTAALHEVKHRSFLFEERPIGPDIIACLKALLADKKAGRLHIDLLRKQLTGEL